MKTLLRRYWLALLITALVWMLVGIVAGAEAFLLVVILTMLEITLSADNAVVNSRVLMTMSPTWQKIFITVGIFIAVFVIRFAIPIFVVSLSTPLDAAQALKLAINDPAAYGQKLEQASSVINSFGGIFLGFVAIFFFIDGSRRDYWIRPIEKALSRLGRVKYSRVVVGMVLIAIIYFLLGGDKHSATIAMLLAAATYGVLHGSVTLMEKFSQNNQTVHKVGWAAFAAFLYLEVLDASFSLDGVVGAFALTNNVVIIMAGLGVGAVWVRSMTLHLTRSKTLLKYRFLESGAHWAILFLAAILILKLFHIELPELIVGSFGLVFIGLSVLSSAKATALPK